MLGEPIVELTCDRCGENEYLTLTSLAGNCWDMRGIDAKIKRLGWTGTKDTDNICPECREERDAKA